MIVYLHTAFLFFKGVFVSLQHMVKPYVANVLNTAFWQLLATTVKYLWCILVLHKQISHDALKLLYTFGCALPSTTLFVSLFSFLVTALVWTSTWKLTVWNCVFYSRNRFLGVMLVQWNFCATLLTILIFCSTWQLFWNLVNLTTSTLGSFRANDSYKDWTLGNLRTMVLVLHHTPSIGF